MPPGLGASLGAALADPTPATLEGVAGELRPRFPRHQVSVETGETAAVRLGAAGASEGTGVGYLFTADHSRVVLALSAPTPATAAGARAGLPDFGDQFTPGPVDLPGSGGRTRQLAARVVISASYAAGALPGDHRLLNDLHAFVMAWDLLLA